MEPPLSQGDQAYCADNVDPCHPFALLNLKEPDEESYLVVERFLSLDFLSRDPQYGEIKGTWPSTGPSGWWSPRMQRRAVSPSISTVWFGTSGQSSPPATGGSSS